MANFTHDPEKMYDQWQLTEVIFICTYNFKKK